ncbi:MAG: hypothetical protein LBN02_05085 [Oscillospiraceae bacterium]|jgi:hypothetical protein|nr:hypothetical protein [Oscillospiraceae bacterium]
MNAVAIVAIALGALLLILIASLITTLRLKTRGMTVLSGDSVNVWFESEKSAAEDVFRLSNERAPEILRKLGFLQKQKVDIFIYDRQYTMQTRKYGLIVPLFGLDWYIGDNIRTNVILTSPANPGKLHDYDNNKNAAIHEMVHAYISKMNPRVKLWLTEGVALYLTNGEPLSGDYLKRASVPTYSDTQSSNPIRFAKAGGYACAHTYIEYLDRTYGWDAVLALLRTEDYAKIFGKSRRDIYHEWTRYVTNQPR